MYNKFKEIFDPLEPFLPSCRMTEKTIRELNEFAAKGEAEKIKEREYQIDGNKIKKRFTTGFGGEMAVGALIGKAFTDQTIGFSKEYQRPDMEPLGLKIGVKASEYGNFPLIFKDSYYPEVIVIKKDNRYTICGVAMPDVLKKYQDDRFVKDKNILTKGGKTAFYGLDQLIPFRTYEELVRIVS